MPGCGGLEGAGFCVLFAPGGVRRAGAVALGGGAFGFVLDRAGWRVSGRVDTEEELWASVEARCAYLQTRPGLIRSHTLFHWWPAGC